VGGAYLIIVTVMAKRTPLSPSEDAKAAALRAAGALHRCPEAVQDETFSSHEFFDQRDLVQVRYEMLRLHRVDGRPVTQIARSFGTSRQAFYKAAAAFESKGIPGLLPHKRGPKRAHKCTDEVLDFVEEWRRSPPPEGGESVAEAVERRFGVSIHPRSIDRALARRKKKRLAVQMETPT
jgi:transposase